MAGDNTEIGLEKVSEERSEEIGPDASAEAAKPAGKQRKPWLIGGSVAFLAAAIATSVFALLPMEDDGGGTSHDAVDVTYKVTGKGVATITYSDGSRTAQRVTDVALPWSHKEQITPGKDTARVSIVLGKGGGHAACSVAVRGEHRQRSTALGSFGRASCSARAIEQQPSR